MTSLFFVLLIAGLLMICLEIFLPGGVIGVLGGISLLGAIAIGFSAFGVATGTYVMIGIVLLLCVSVVLWIKYFPRTIIGKSMTLAKDGSDFKASDDHYRYLVGKEGESVTDLRPAGIVLIEGAKYDVVSEGSLVDKGSRVKVIKASGSRIVVRQARDEKGGEAS